MIEKMIEKGLLDDFLGECIGFKDKEQYWQLFKQHQCAIIPRKRMCLDYKRPLDLVTEFEGVSFEPMTIDNLEPCSRISYKAHRLSKDQLYSIDMGSLEKRQGLDRHVFSKSDNKIIEESTFYVKKEGEYVGGLIMVEVACWGIEKMPWIFDIFLDPKYHGEGIGKKMLHHAIQVCQGLKYEMMGLAVTLSNTSALKLYETTGFYETDVFNEVSKEANRSQDI